jgi:hypothetical protein
MPARTRDPRRRSRGQVLVIFAMTSFVFIGLCAVVVDVAWYWANNLRIQRAADAAALAGVVYLPGDVPTAVSTARAEATKNGYTDGVDGYTVTPTQDPANPRRLRVTISGPVGTYFAHVLGINSFPASRRSKAEFVLPVPMGSPEAYYGVFGTIRGATFTSPQPTNVTTNTGWREASSWPAGTAPNASNWTTPQNADDLNDNIRGVSLTADQSVQHWGGHGISMTSPVQAIDGIELRMRAEASGSGTPSGCQVQASLSWDSGTTWTATKNQNVTTTETSYTLGNSTTDTWGHSWTVNELENQLQVRLRWINPASCGATRTALIDTLEVRVTYKYGTTVDVTQNLGDIDQRGPGSACVNGIPDCFQPDGSALNDRGFWGTMNTRGASNVNGDAHQPSWDTAGSTSAPTCPAGNLRSCYDANEYYNYGVEMPAGSVNGYVYIFDPGFCATQNNKGTGDRWFTDGSNSSREAVSSWYELLNTNNTPYDLTDDTVVASSGSMFTNLRASDSTMGGPSFAGAVECRQRDSAYGDGRDYHDAWWLMNPGSPLTGGAGGTVYRLHTTGTPPGGGSAQLSTNGEQSFSVFVSATLSGSQGPRIYGLGAMQMFTPLSTAAGSGTQSEFYLAQIDAVHAGKTMQIELWDPGDTSPLAANVQILMPTTGGYVAASMSYDAQVGTSNSNVNSACNNNQVLSPATTNNIVTSTGASLGVFNGCWLQISVQIPASYTGADLGAGPGWWKIRYNMTGSGTSNDVTTWKVSIRGNPVHLIVP